MINLSATATALKEYCDLDVKTSKVLVVGLGVTGISVARFLQQLGFKFAVTDSRDKPPGIDILLNEIPDAPLFIGGFDESAFKVATHLVVSPGIALTDKAIIKAVANGAKIVSDIDLFACAADAPIVAITGSNGKSTVTTMLGEMAKAAGRRVGVGGNLGIPALDLLAQPTVMDDGSVVSSSEFKSSADLFVLELSSFQLERTTVLNAAVATVLNISPDHLDRHASLTEYAAEKQKIFNGSGVMVINIDDPIVDAMYMQDRRVLTFSIKTKADFYLQKTAGIEYLMHEEEILMPLSAVPLEGRHNAANALSALALGVAVGLDMHAMCLALRQFKGLDHRMQRVAQIRGVNWVNDSKATNIGACVAALQGYEQKVVLIAGGDAKGADMAELTPAIKEKAKSVVLIGKDAELIERALDGCVPAYFAADMNEAVQIAARLAHAGESVLLSPACASLDQYKNYQDRGNKFTKAVMALVARV